MSRRTEPSGSAVDAAAGRPAEAWRRDWVCSREEAAEALALLDDHLAAAGFPLPVLIKMRRLVDEALAHTEPPAWLVIHHRLVESHLDLAVENPGESLIRVVLLRDGRAEWQRWGWRDHDLRLCECRIIH
jgi:hypothetical protein